MYSFSLVSIAQCTLPMFLNLPQQISHPKIVYVIESITYTPTSPCLFLHPPNDTDSITDDSKFNSSAPFPLDSKPVIPHLTFSCPNSPQCLLVVPSFVPWLLLHIRSHSAPCTLASDSVLIISVSINGHSKLPSF